jgi:hypothetical protein
MQWFIFSGPHAEALPTRYGVTAGGEALASSMASAVEGVVVGICSCSLVHSFTYLFAR